jgi:hypothetical protein
MSAKPSSVPSNIATVEQLAVWAIMTSAEAFPNQFYSERAGVTSWAAEYQITKAPDGSRFFVGRVVLPLIVDSGLASGAKPWLAADQVPGGIVVPAYYSTN